MTCDELRPDYLPYALGVLADPERSEMRAHLDRGCESCTAGLKEARAWAYAMGAGVEGPAPPRQLRTRILAAAGAPAAQRWSWLTALATAAAVASAAAILLVYQGKDYRQQEAELRAQIDRSAAEAANLREALALIQSPDTREVVFGQGQPAPPRGRVFFQSSGVLLIASHLPAPPSGKTYEMWIIRGGKPAPAGTFGSSADGNAIHLYRPAAAPAPSDVVAVTLENAGGVDAPTSTPIIVAPL